MLHTKTTKGHNNLLGTGYLVEILSFRKLGTYTLEIPIISNSRCEKPSILKFLIRST